MWTRLLCLSLVLIASGCVTSEIGPQRQKYFEMKEELTQVDAHCRVLFAEYEALQAKETALAGQRAIARSPLHPELSTFLLRYRREKTPEEVQLIREHQDCVDRVVLLSSSLRAQEHSALIEEDTAAGVLAPIPLIDVRVWRMP